MQHLLDCLRTIRTPTVALVGDFMLDRYVFGDVERISPEAPVPVLKTVRREDRVGGAGNVAATIPPLGGRVTCVGVAGEDASGRALLAGLDEAGADCGALVGLSDRCTTVKTRYVGLAQHRRAQQMFRVDDERVDGLPDETLAEIERSFFAALDRADVVAMEDYGKGVVSHERTAEWIAAARKAGKPVLVDPALIDDYRRYRGGSLLTPNRYEAELAAGVRIETEADLPPAAARLIDAAEADAVVITLDREGMYLHERSGRGKLVRTRPRAVYDVSGAGDVVLAMLSLAIGSGCPLEEACELANVAGGLEVERFGIVPIAREEVIDEIEREIGLRRSKVMDRGHLADEIARRKRRGETVVFTNGCFDLLHMGHVRYLQQARELGTCLIVATNSDDSVRRLKGAGRPIIGEAERAEMLASLECVDFVTIFEEDTPEPLLERLRPDVLVKGGTTPVIVGRELVEGYGGKVLNLPAVEGLSTTQIIEKIGNSVPAGQEHPRR